MDGENLKKCIMVDVGLEPTTRKILGLSTTPFANPSGTPRGFCGQKKISILVFFAGQTGLFSPGMKKDKTELERRALYSTATHAHTHTWQHPWTRPTGVHAGRRMKPARRLGSSAVRSHAFPSPRLSGAFSENYRSTLFPQGSSTLI